MSESMAHNLLLLRYVFVILAIIANFVTGLLYFRNAVQRRNFDMAMVILLGFYAMILLLIPIDYYLWNYLGIGYGVLFFAFILKLNFWEIITKGSTKEKIFVVLGIVAILLVLIFGAYIKLPAFFDYLPAF